MATLKSYLQAVDKKLNDPAVKRLLQFGQTFSNKVTPVRDAMGMEMTRQSIMQTAENAFNILDGRVALSNMFKNFSAGHSDVAKVETVGAIDLTILAMSQSLIPFICVDRGLATPTSTIYFNNIVSKNDAGGVKAGDKVSGNFMPPNTNVNLGLAKSGNEATEGVISLGNDILPGTVKVTVSVDKAGVFVGQDFGKDGVIYFNGGAVSATVDYASGKVTLTGMTEGMKAKADATLDSTKDESGNNVLTVIPEWTPVTLETEPMNIVLQNNLANMMFMQKTYTTATGSASSPYNDVLFQRVKNTYIEAINSLILKKLVAACEGKVLTLDLSDYGTQAFAQTKNDLVSQLISNMRATLLGRTGCPLTALIVNSNAAAIIEQIPIQFVANPMINMGLNGLIGYYNGIPVFRHNALDGVIGSYNPGANAHMFGVFRNADNTSGSQVFGEFIPFTSTGNVSNFNMPVQNSTGFFSQVGSKTVQGNLVVHGMIKLSSVVDNGMFVDFTEK